MEKLPKKQGITMLALVITVITLLILSGIILITVSGEDGIIIRSQQSKDKTIEAQAKEIINIVLSEWQVEKTVEGVKIKDFLSRKNCRKK